MQESISVQQFNSQVNLHLKKLGNTIVEGEIAQMSITQRGGISIELKDPKAQAILRVSGYAPRIQGIDSVREGMQVLVFGVPEIWEQRGLFSLNAFKILPVGEGALKEAFEQLKQKLLEEGLFDESRKRPLPQYFKKIALITAKNSAAQSDFIKILQENRAGLLIDFYPVHVQGTKAEAEIIAAVTKADTKKYDAIVVTRGGGSLEDLIAFNDEKVSRTIFASKTPVIAAIGHERDDSIVEYVADKRASTPSQAAYYIVTTNTSFLEGLNQYVQVIESSIFQKLTAYKHELEGLTTTLNLNMQGILRTQYSRLELKLLKIESRLKAEVSNNSNKVQQHQLKIQHILSTRVTRLKYQLDKHQRILANFPKQVTQIKHDLEYNKRILNSYDPRKVLERGYALVTDTDGKVLTSVSQFQGNQAVKINLKDGKLEANITKLHKHNDKN